MNQTARNDHQLERQADRQKEHAVILLHGLCGSSLELGTIPKALKKANCTVVEMQIPNYSASMTDPRLTPNWMDWCAMVESKVVKLKEEHKTVSLCGLSMGATLALAVASFSKEILCVVLLSPVLRYDGWSIPWYHRLMNIPYSLGYRNWTYKESDPYGIKNFEMRRRVAAALKKDGVAAVGAAAIPARHLWAAQKLMAYVRQSLSQVRAGTLVIHSIDDETAAPRNARANGDRQLIRPALASASSSPTRVTTRCISLSSATVTVAPNQARPRSSWVVGSTTFTVFIRRDRCDNSRSISRSRLRP